MDLKSLSLEQLKVLVYDSSRELVRLQNLIQLANQEIDSRPKEEKKEG